MPATYDLSTQVGKVRLLIPDKQITDPDVLLFQDDEIEALLSLSQDSVAYATALALETIATDTVMLLKASKIMDISFNGPADAEALYKRAATLRENWETIDNTVEEIESGVMDALNVVDDFSWRNWIWRESD